MTSEEISGGGNGEVEGGGVDTTMCAQLGALWKACALSPQNSDLVRTTGLQHIENEFKRSDCTEELKRSCLKLLLIFSRLFRLSLICIVQSSVCNVVACV